MPSWDIRDKGPRPSPTRPEPCVNPSPWFVSPQPNAKFGTFVDPNVKVSLARTPCVDDVSPYVYKYSQFDLQEEIGRASHRLLVQGRVLYVEELDGSNNGVACVKHSTQGLHWVQMRSLPVSKIAEKGRLGVPMAKSMRYSPLPAWTGDWTFELESAAAFIVLAISLDIRWWLRRAARWISSTLEKLPLASTRVRWTLRPFG